MADLIFVLATVAFFALCVLYVNWCDRIIGPDNFRSGPSNDAATVLQSPSGNDGSAASPAAKTEVTV